MSDEISTSTIDEAAATPKKVSTEEGMVEERSIDDLIKADRYSKAQSATSKVPWGARMARVKPGGTV